MNRTDLETAVFRDFGYGDAPATGISNRIRGYLNDRHRRLLGRPGLERFRTETTTFATVAAQATYSLAAPIERILKITDTTNDVPIYERGLDWYRNIEPDATNSSGAPQYYIQRGVSPALRDIGGTVLYVVSTSATDAGGSAVVVHVETIDANGSITSATASTNGLTRVQIGTAANHSFLLRFNTATTPVGVLQLYDALAAGNKVSEIDLGRTNAQFVRIALWPTPSAIDTLQVDYIHQIRDFSTAGDEPQVPLDFHYLVGVGARIDEARKKGQPDPRIDQWEREWNAGIAQLIFFTSTNPDTLFIPGRLGADIERSSNLGSFFPSGRW